MKRSRVDSTSSEESSVYSEKSSSELDIFDDDEIKEVMQDLSQSTIPKDKALDFLHSLAASKSILYWNSHGEMTYHQRRIPLTNIVELIEYAMLPYNLDVRTPRGLKTFTNGLSEVGIDKTLIRNKRLLADLVARQPEEEDTDDESGEEETNESEAESTSTESDSGKSESSESDDEPKECHLVMSRFIGITLPYVKTTNFTIGHNRIMRCTVVPSVTTRTDGDHPAGPVAKSCNICDMPQGDQTTNFTRRTPTDNEMHRGTIRHHSYRW
ncbi:hypothetical protein QZH41_004112 [Actinostola sp. cb2023]|nr:hypothetical protein QZH41_004112 [Actinostola sp. cb2023]